MKLKDKKGQAIIETMMFIPVLIMISVMLFWAADYVLTKQQLLSAARYGTDMIYYTDMNQDAIKNELIRYLTDRAISGRKLDKHRLNINIDIQRSGSILDSEKFSKVELEYLIKVPHLFKAIADLAGLSGSEPNDIKVTSMSSVLAGFS